MIKTYYLNINSGYNQIKLGQLKYVLSEEERLKADKFRFEQDCNLYIAGKIISRIIIAGLTGINPEEINFYSGKDNKPQLKYPKAKNFYFNLSHSGDFVLLAVSDKRVGIDIEQIKPIDLKIADEMFHDKEVKYLFDKKSKQQDKFYQIWTLKESFIKAIGKGFSRSLKSYYFELSGKNPKIYFKNKKDILSEWNFRMYGIDRDYKAAVCAESNLPPVKCEKIIL